MGNILNYIDWRGDITLKNDGFCDVDNLILSVLSHVNFNEFLADKNKETTIKDAYEAFLNSKSSIPSNRTSSGNVTEVFKKMANSKRFGDMRISCYENQFDEKEEKQFSALLIRLGDGTIYVSFRGTDDSLTGWKENLNMSYQEYIPAQLEAVRYLNKIPVKVCEKILVGGHSKGGNLAIYAAVKCNKKIKSKIIQVYSNDAPGFSSEMIQSQEYQEILPKIKAIIPQSSLVGMLLEHGETYQVIQSNSKGLTQHDALTWEVLGNSFVCLSTVTEESKYTEATINTWIYSMNPDQREQFSNAVYQFIKLSGQSVSDFFSGKVKISHIIRAWISMDKNLRDYLILQIKTLLSSLRNAKIKYKKSLRYKTVQPQAENNMELYTAERINPIDNLRTKTKVCDSMQPLYSTLNK